MDTHTRRAVGLVKPVGRKRVIRVEVPLVASGSDATKPIIPVVRGLSVFFFLFSRSLSSPPLQNAETTPRGLCERGR